MSIFSSESNSANSNSVVISTYSPTPKDHVSPSTMENGVSYASVGSTPLGGFVIPIIVSARSSSLGKPVMIGKGKNLKSFSPSLEKTLRSHKKGSKEKS